MKIDKPDPRIGAIATDVDVRSLSDSDWNALYRAWLDGIVLVVRGQTLTIEEFLAYSRRFGRLKTGFCHRRARSLCDTSRSTRSRTVAPATRPPARTVWPSRTGTGVASPVVNA